MSSPSATVMANDAPVLLRAPGVGAGMEGRVPRRRRLRRWFFHRLVRSLMLAHRAALCVATVVGRMAGHRATHRGEIVLTGMFYSENWVVSHLRPLAASSLCERVVLVSTFPIPPLPKVLSVYPPPWLVGAVGATVARLLTFAATVLHRRPEWVGGFHLLVNGLLASVLARLIGGKAVYFCVGGPAEVKDGGIEAENRVFGRMETADAVVARRLICAVNDFDLVIAMGTRAVSFFRSRGVSSRCHVVSGGIDVSQFAPTDAPPSTDLIFVGRLAAIKRVDILLRAIQIASAELPELSAVIVGDGELRAPLEQLARQLGIRNRVRFVGHQRNVADWLCTARVFVLTSDSEGLALSLMEAMLCGLPAVVSNVGDLADLIEHGVNGNLVGLRTPEAFAGCFVELLRDPQRWASLSRAARQTALRHDWTKVTRRWDAILHELRNDLLMRTERDRP